MTHPLVIALILLIQALTALFFLWETLAALLGLGGTPISWALYELIEIGAGVGLLLGLLMGGVALRHVLRRNRRVERQLRAAAGAFAELLQERFDIWGLTPAERDVALFAIKGLSTADIAALRETSEGTVKAQTAAIYRKAGVNGRPQLLSLFIEDLMDESLLPPASDAKAAAGAAVGAHDR